MLTRSLVSLCFAVAVAACMEDAVTGADDSEVSRRCSLDPDRDDDGWYRIECGGYDCDDDDPLRAPSHYELCDEEERDEDCDLGTPGSDDEDGDGYIDAFCKNRAADGGVTSEGIDCDDDDAQAHPGQHELCNDRDDDCDEEVDEGATTRSYVDGDGDGYGHGKPKDVCAGPVGFAAVGGDCDDDDALMHPGAFRCAASGGDGAIELCKKDGTFAADTCTGASVCVPQPNGTGICVPGDCGDGDDAGCD